MKPITKKQCIQLVKEIKTELPDRVNPTEGNSCVYHNGGRGQSVRRCMVGEVIHRLGLPRPEGNGSAYDTLFFDYPDRFTESAMVYLHRIQILADGVGVEEGILITEPRRWGDVPVYV